MRRLQRYFISGLLTLIPIWLVWIVFKFVFALLSGISQPVIAPITARLAASDPRMLGWLAAPWVQTAIALVATVLATVFGPQVTATVLDVTDDKSLDKHVRKQRQIEHAPHISKEAKLVKLADKICNLRDILASPPADWSPERKQGYFDWAAKVVAGVRGVHPELEAVFDGLLARHAELR